jgi:hypothetical protein
MQHKFYTLYSIDFADFLIKCYRRIFWAAVWTSLPLTVLTNLVSLFFFLSSPTPSCTYGLAPKNVPRTPKTLEYG